jgi:hypothetical protein
MPRINRFLIGWEVQTRIDAVCNNESIKCLRSNKLVFEVSSTFSLRRRLKVNRPLITLIVPFNTFIQRRRSEVQIAVQAKLNCFFVKRACSFLFSLE